MLKTCAGAILAAKFASQIWRRRLRISDANYFVRLACTHVYFPAQVQCLLAFTPHFESSFKGTLISSKHRAVIQIQQVLNLASSRLSRLFGRSQYCSQGLALTQLRAVGLTCAKMIHIACRSDWSLSRVRMLAGIFNFSTVAKVTNCRMPSCILRQPRRGARKD